MSGLKRLGMKPQQGEKTGDFYYQKLLDEESKKESPDWKQVKQYIGFEVHPSPPDGDTAMTLLHKAALQGQTEVVKWIVSQPNVDVDGKNKYGRSPLHFACDAGHSEIVTLLLDAKADVNCMSLGGLTPLHVAARQNHAACAKALFSSQQHVDVHAETAERQTPVMLTHDPAMRAIIAEYGNALDE